MRELWIDGTRIADSEPCYVIAEIGHNHMGDVGVCKRLFLAAKQAGASAVKLQKRDIATLYTREVLDTPYLGRNSYGPTYGAHREALEFNAEQYLELQHYACEIGITFFATAFDIPSLEFLAELDMPAIKIASGDLQNEELIRAAAGLLKPIIISTGGGTPKDIERARDWAGGRSNIAILQCTSGYPAAFNELNLNVIAALRAVYPDIVIGYSGHDAGIAMAVAAYTLGATIIEKHFTLNRTNRGTDHAFSLEPVGLHKMVRDLHRTRVALGDGYKRRYDSEDTPLRKQEKQLVNGKWQISRI